MTRILSCDYRMDKLATAEEREKLKRLDLPAAEYQQITTRLNHLLRTILFFQVKKAREAKSGTAAKACKKLQDKGTVVLVSTISDREKNEGFEMNLDLLQQSRQIVEEADSHHQATTKAVGGALSHPEKDAGSCSNQ